MYVLILTELGERWTWIYWQPLGVLAFGWKVRIDMQPWRALRLPGRSTTASGEVVQERFHFGAGVLVACFGGGVDAA
jgi:hypothetical protein